MKLLRADFGIDCLYITRSLMLKKCRADCHSIVQQTVPAPSITASADAACL